MKKYMFSYLGVHVISSCLKLKMCFERELDKQMYSLIRVWGLGTENVHIMVLEPGRESD